MATEYADQKTKVTTTEMAAALAEAWFRYFGSYVPSANCIKVLVAQWALETGFGASMHCYNVGNIKAKESDDHCYFACNEVLLKSHALKAYAEDLKTGLAKITKEYDDGRCIVWFYPKHPGCRFRAYATLADGAFDYLKLLIEHKRFSKAWPAVLQGDPQQFSQLLHDAGYYTASVASYTSAVLRIFKTLSDAIVPEHLVNALTPAEREKLFNTIYASLQDLAGATYDRQDDGS